MRLLQPPVGDVVAVVASPGKPPETIDREGKRTPVSPAMGRPAKHPDKPWLALGISRVTWYNRQKKGKQP